MKYNKGSKAVKRKSPYDPKFVAKILKSEQQAREGKTVTIDPNDIWNPDVLSGRKKS
jgi:hypothetical protein